MEKIILLFLVLAISCNNKPDETSPKNAQVYLNADTGRINHIVVSGGETNYDTAEASFASIFKQMSNIKTDNIKAVEHIYMNAWIDGCNAAIEAQQKGILSNKYLDIKAKNDSTKFSNDFRKRNNR